MSGGDDLEKRPGLSRAIAMVEAGDVDTIVVAYFDRLVRSLAIQAELVARVEAASGGILAVDVGAVTNGSAGQWLSSSVLGPSPSTSGARPPNGRRRRSGGPSLAASPPSIASPRLPTARGPHARDRPCREADRAGGVLHARRRRCNQGGSGASCATTASTASPSWTPARSARSTGGPAASPSRR